MSTWLPCPYAADYRFDIGHVRALWPALHAVDAEPTPHSDALWHAWALFHSGQFEQATDAGLASCWVDGMPFIDSVRFAQGCSSMALACEYTNNPELSIANVTSLVENTECLN